MSVGSGVIFAFVGLQHVEFVGFPGLIFEVTPEWRGTTPIREIATWTETDVWPGPLPEEEHP
jgi:hypothetical protein